MNEAALHIWLKSVTDRFEKKIGHACESHLWFTPGEGWVVRISRKRDDPYTIFYSEEWSFKGGSMAELMEVGNKWVDEYDAEAYRAKTEAIVNQHMMATTGVLVQSGLTLATSSGGGRNIHIIGGGGGISSVYANALNNTALANNQQLQNMLTQGAVSGQNPYAHSKVQSPLTDSFQAKIAKAYDEMTKQPEYVPLWKRLMEQLKP